MIKTEETTLEPEFQEYINFINDMDLAGQAILTPQKIDDHFEQVGQALNQLKAYPDILVDIITPSDSKFSLYFYQRLILRSFARFKQTYTTATRAASKSFLAFLSRYLMCMQTPNHKTFVCANIKKQAAEIAKQKIQEDLWEKFPLLKNEMIKIPQPGKAPMNPFLSGADYATYRFSNGSIFDVINVDSARGLRRNSGIFEEVIEQDQTKINEKVIPLMNVSRRTSKGVVLENEPNAQKIFVTTAGYHGTFAYDKFIETLCLTSIDPTKYMAFGLTFKIPLAHNLLDAEQVREVIASPTFDKDAFDREYNSIWSGSLKGAAFDYKVMQQCRKVVRAELKAHELEQDKEFYIVCADLAKDGSANTAVVVLRVKIGDTHFTYKLVNAFQANDNDYMKVANELKKAAIAYNARMLIYDANGVGAGMRDWLNKPTTDYKTGEILNGLGIINPPESAVKDVIRYPAKETICYEIKAGSQASDINYLFFARIKSGAIKMLIPFKDALEKYKIHKGFCTASMSKQKEVLKPYQMADRIQEELLNLDVVEILDTGKPALKVTRRNSSIQKDFFSAFSYGVWGVHEYIELPFYRKNAKGRLTRLEALQKIQGIIPVGEVNGKGKYKHY